MDDVIPILHGERARAYHHDGHGNVIVGAIGIRVPESVAEIEIVTASALVYVITDLRRTFHVQDKGLPFIPFNQLGENLLAIAFASQILTHGKVPEPVE